MTALPGAANAAPPPAPVSPRRPLARAAVRLVRLYREGVSPLRPPACRYQPTCSGYAVEAIERFGLARGAWLALRRLLRCHPLHAGGHDPVPLTVGRAGHDRRVAARVGGTDAEEQSRA